MTAFRRKKKTFGWKAFFYVVIFQNWKIIFEIFEVFLGTNSEDAIENEDEDDSPNAALLKFIAGNRENLRKDADGTSKDVVFTERLQTL